MTLTNGCVHTGTSRAEEKYKTGKKTTDISLEILNLSKTEVVSIDSISNQEFTEVIIHLLIHHLTHCSKREVLYTSFQMLPFIIFMLWKSSDLLVSTTAFPKIPFTASESYVS